MGISRYKIKKWFNMVIGKSISHVNQNIGKVYSKDDICGYYNDLTEKVIKRSFNGNKVPKSMVDTGEEIYFSIEIFQYGLGAFDLYLLNNDKSMLEKTIACANWAIDNQQENGSWITFDYQHPESPYSAMAQGEGISLLTRAYLTTKNEDYCTALKKAKDFMLKPIDQGGTTLYVENDVYFYECTYAPLVLNGWIFSLWGIIDYCKLIEDSQTKHILEQTLSTLEQHLPDFDMQYWSKYDNGNRICSPFYNKLHVEQLKVMFNLTQKEIYKKYAEKWENCQSNFFYRNYAFIKKAVQKIFD